MELAHISDLHLPLPARLPWGRFFNKRIVGYLNLKTKRYHPPEIGAALVKDLRERPPDHLAVTGDLTNLSLEAEFFAAADYVRMMGLPPERLTVIPGNHDAYVREATRERHFERAFEPVLGVEKLTWPRVQRIGGELLLVSANSGVPSPWFTAWGKVSREQLAALDEQLAAAAPYKILLVHHPLLQRDGRPDHLIRRNRDYRALLDLCRRRDVDLVLCGHTHRPFRLTLDGPRPLRIFCAGSTTDPPRDDVVGERAAYNRYRFEGAKLVSLEVRAWDPVRGEFRTLLEEAVT